MNVEAEIIKEKVKPAPVKKGINVKKIINNHVFLFMMTFNQQMVSYCFIEPEVSKKAPESKPEPVEKGGNFTDCIELIIFILLHV